MGTRRLSIPHIPGDTISHSTPHPESCTTSAHSKHGYVLGILGGSNYYKEDDITQVLQTAKELWGDPQQILIPLEGTTSMFTESWAQANKIPTILIDADWKQYGRRACILRNAKIEKEATQFIIVRSPRSKSDKMILKAEALAKGHKEVLVLVGHDTDTKALTIDYHEAEPVKIKEKISKKAEKKSPKSNNKTDKGDIRSFLSSTK